MKTMNPVLYLVQRFRPHFEATSKEVYFLWTHLQSYVHDLHFDGYFTWKWEKNRWSYHAWLYPAIFPWLYLWSRNKIVHIYTGVPDSIYLPFLSKENMVVTATNFFSSSDIRRKASSLKRVKRIIVQSELQRQALISCGVTPQNIVLILPPVDLGNFRYQKAKSNFKISQFKILNASCPTKVSDLDKRGILLLLGLEPELKEKGMEITLAWRKGLALAQKSLGQKYIPGKAVQFQEQIHPNMDDLFAAHHATIVSYTKLSPQLKLVPLSVLESLAAGKPVLVSSCTGIAEIVAVEKCGVVFEPTPESLLAAIEELRRNYFLYQNNCRKTAEKYFSQEEFLRKHKEIYESLS